MFHVLHWGCPSTPFICFDRYYYHGISWTAWAIAKWILCLNWCKPQTLLSPRCGYIVYCLFLCVFFVSTVMDFSGEDKASGVKFCMLVHRRPGQGISHSNELCFPFRGSDPPINIFAAVNKRRIGRVGRVSVIVTRQMHRSWNRAACGRRSACVDIRPSSKTESTCYCITLPSYRQHLSCGDCLEGKRGDYLTSSVLLCIIIVHIMCTPI